jgi:lipopolysaccharide transport system permease protein
MAIVLYMTYTELRAESERTYVGYLWWIVEPLVSLAVYYVVFGLVLIRAIDNYVAFLFVGLVPWRWLNSTLMHGSTSILKAKGLMRQVYLPKLIFPIVAILSDGAKFFVVFLIVIGFVVVSGFPITWSYLFLPAIVLVQGLLIAGATLVAAAITPFLPDFRIVLENLVRLWFFLSGIFYQVSSFPENAQEIFRLNPMVSILESYRTVLLHGGVPDLSALGVTAVAAVLLLFAAAKLVQAQDFNYPKLAL